MHISNMYVKYLSVRSVQKVHCAFSYRKLNQMFRVFFSFIFYRCSATSTAALADCVCFSFRCWLHYFFFFLYSLSQFICFCFCFISVSIRFCHFILRISSVHCPLVLLCYLRLSLSLAAVSVFDCAFSAAAAAAFQCCCCCFIFNTYNLLIVSLLVFAYAKCFVHFSVSFSRLHCELCSVFSVCLCV